MQNDKTDRRVQRTRQLLQNALAQLIQEKGYDAVTIQDITDRANVGRTTFYLHYRGKDDLFISSHVNGMMDYRFGLFSKDELLGDETPANLIAVFEYLKGNRPLFDTLKHGKDAVIIIRVIQENVARNLENSLCTSLSQSESHIPFSVLANYLAGSQISFMAWWIERRVRYTPQEMARIFHQLQRAAIREALGI